MSSEEDFSLVSEPPPEDSLLGSGTASDCPFQHQRLEPAAGFETHQLMTPGASSSRAHSLEEDRAHKELRMEKETLDLLRQREERLLMEIQSTRAALRAEDTLQERLKQQAQVLSCLPERGVYLAGLVSRSGDTPAFDTTSRIVYPMEGGTALITFEEEAVAKEVLRMKQHSVSLGPDYRIRVEAQPVQLVVPQQVEMDSLICSRRVLVSDLPRMDPESLVDKLGFHFSKKANGGGDVEACQMMEDTWTAVITFTEDDIVGALALKQFHDVRVQKTSHRVRVTPFISGQMSSLKVQAQVCSRTVLLTGIPDVLDPETLQDFLEVHFQKGSSGGGEVLHCLYNPLGRRTQAAFSGRSKV